MVVDEDLFVEDSTTTVQDEVHKQVHNDQSYGDLKQDIHVLSL